MPMKLGEILEKSIQIAEESGLQADNQVHRFTISQIIKFINTAASRVFYESNPEGKTGDKINMDMTMPNTSLFEILSDVESMNMITDSTQAFFHVLSDTEKNEFKFFARIVSLSESIPDRAASQAILKELLKSQLIPQLSPGSAVRRIIDAILNDQSPSEETERVINERGGEIKKVNKTNEVEIFLRRFRLMIEQQIGTAAQA